MVIFSKHQLIQHNRYQIRMNGGKLISVQQRQLTLYYMRIGKMYFLDLKQEVITNSLLETIIWLAWTQFAHTQLFTQAGTAVQQRCLALFSEFVKLLNSIYISMKYTCIQSIMSNKIKWQLSLALHSLEVILNSQFQLVHNTWKQQQ